MDWLVILCICWICMLPSLFILLQGVLSYSLSESHRVVLLSTECISFRVGKWSHTERNITGAEILTMRARLGTDSLFLYLFHTFLKRNKYIKKNRQDFTNSWKINQKSPSGAQNKTKTVRNKQWNATFRCTNFSLSTALLFSHLFLNNQKKKQRTKELGTTRRTLIKKFLKNIT